MSDIAGEAKKSKPRFFYELLHKDAPLLADQQGITFISYMRTLVVVWMPLPGAMDIRDGCRLIKRESEHFVQSA